MKEDQNLYFNAVLKGNRSEALAIAKRYSTSHEQIKLFYDKIVKPSLYKVGELWENNLISVAAEHLATATTESIMNEIYSYIINENRVSKKIALGCIENEYHQVGIKMIADVFEMHGWDTYFLGANIPNTEFIRFAKEIDADCIGLSLSIYSHLPQFENMLKLCISEFPETQIIAGGQAFLHGGKEVVDKYKNVNLIGSFKELEAYISKLDEHEQIGAY